MLGNKGEELATFNPSTDSYKLVYEDHIFKLFLFNYRTHSWELADTKTPYHFLTDWVLRYEEREERGRE